MAKRKSRPVPAVIARHGQDQRFRRGELEVIPRALDPDGRMVSRAQTMPVYVKLQRRGTLSLVQSAAAEHYAQLIEAEGGARWTPPKADGVFTPAWQRASAAMEQTDAADELRHIHAVIGPAARSLVLALVVGNMDIKDIAALEGQSAEKTSGRICAVLTRLAEIWVEYEARPRRKKNPGAGASGAPSRP